jgi:hypothetical protein
MSIRKTDFFSLSKTDLYLLTEVHGISSQDRADFLIIDSINLKLPEKYPAACYTLNMNPSVLNNKRTIIVKACC